MNLDTATTCKTRLEILETFDGDAAFASEIAIAFLNHCPVVVEEIRSGIEAGEATTISRAAHLLKGTIGYFDEGDALASVRH